MIKLKGRLSLGIVYAISAQRKNIYNSNKINRKVIRQVKQTKTKLNASFKKWIKLHCANDYLHNF